MQTQRSQYSPDFLPTQLRNALTAAGINPNVSHMRTVKGRSRTVSPLGHEKRSMAAAIDHILLNTPVDDAKTILTMMDNDPDIMAQRQRFLREGKDGVTMDDLIGKVNGHIKYYSGENFPRHFKVVFGEGKPQREALLKIRRSLNIWVSSVWKPTLKTYRAALDAACVAAAHNVDLAFGDTPPPSDPIPVVVEVAPPPAVETAPASKTVRRKKKADALPLLTESISAGETENLAGAAAAEGVPGAE